MKAILEIWRHKITPLYRDLSHKLDMKYNWLPNNLYFSLNFLKFLRACSLVNSLFNIFFTNYGSSNNCGGVMYAFNCAFSSISLISSTLSPRSFTLSSKDITPTSPLSTPPPSSLSWLEVLIPQPKLTPYLAFASTKSSMV